MDTFPFFFIVLWAVGLLLLVSGKCAVGSTDTWDEIKSLELLDGEGFKTLVYPLVEMTANAYRYPAVISIKGWTLVDAVAPIHGGMHAVVYEDDFVAGRMVLAFRGTDLSGSESSRADFCADEILWGEASSFILEDCSEFSSETLDYYQQAMDYTRKVLETHPDVSLLLTGHSLGAGLAILVTASFSSKLILPVIAFSAVGTKAILEKKSLKLTADHDQKLYIVADKWDEIMRLSWKNQVGMLCLYETTITENCARCFRDENIPSSKSSLRGLSTLHVLDLPPGTPSRILVTTHLEEEIKEGQLESELNQYMPDSTSSMSECLICFFETHYLKHVIGLVELGNKPVCESRMSQIYKVR